MTFNSINFLFFLSVTFLLYWIAFSKTKSRQNLFISITGLVFYACWDWRFSGLIIATILSTYFGGLLIAKAKKQEAVFLKKKKSWWIFISVLLLNIGILFFFKYFNFFIQSFIDVFSLFGKKTDITLFKIMLPIGISFYTFTALSYLIDIYKDKTLPNNDFFAYVAYVSFFPALFCGPVGRSTEQLPQFFSKRVFSLSFITKSAQLMLWGFFMKLCVADRIAEYISAVTYNIPQHSGLSLLLAVVLYPFQLYCDFGGYSLIAIGVGTLFGINLQENFRRPYLSVSFSEYWKRNHISLTRWLMDYIYYPLIGYSDKLRYWNFCMIVTFLISGFWHGVGWTFILWGLYQGLFIVLSTNNAKRRKKFEKKRNLQNNILYKTAAIIITFVIISLGLMFFRINNINDVFLTVKTIFTNFSFHIDTALKPIAYISIGMIILLFKEIRDEFFPNNLRLLENPNMILRLSGYTFLIILIILIGVLDNYQFIYFKF